jgi:hypothetical protein
LGILKDSEYSPARTGILDRESETRLLSRWRSLDDPGEVFARSISWHPSGMSQPLAIDVPALFEDALG